MSRLRCLTLLLLLCLVLPGLRNAEAPLLDRTIPARWRTCTRASEPSSAIASTPDGLAIWTASSAGVECWDLQTRTYVKYTTADGLVSDKVRTLRVAPDGVVWIGTREGASRFDGTIWTTYTVDNSGLPSNSIWRIVVEPASGVVWFCFEGAFGVTRYDGNAWTTYTSANSGLAHDSVSALAIGPSGALWCGTDFGTQWYWWRKWTGAGVSRYDGTSWTTHTVDDGLPSNRISRLFADCYGGVWLKAEDEIIYMEYMPDVVAREGGLARFDGTSWTPVSIDEEWFWPRANDSEGGMWASGSRGIERFDGESWTVVIPHTHASQLAVDALGQVWLSVGPHPYDWLAVYDGTVLISLRGGLHLEEVRAIATDDLGNVWFGGSEFVERFDGQGWTRLHIGPSHTHASAQFMAVDGRHNLWTKGGGSHPIMAWDGAEWTSYTYTSHNGVANEWPSCITARGDDVWVGHRAHRISYEPDELRGGGVSHFDGSGWTVYTPENSPLPIAHVVDIEIDREGNVWVAYEQCGLGAWRFDGTAWTSCPLDPSDLVGDEPDLRCHCVGMFAFGREGAQWAGGGRSVSRLDESGWHTFYPDTTGVSSSIRDMLVDSRGWVWIGDGDGVICYDGTDWRRYTTADGLPESYVSDIAEDSSGNVWIATSYGVSVFTPAVEVKETCPPIITMPDWWESGPTIRGGVLAAQEGAFVAEFDARPDAVPMDGLIGLSLGEANALADLACIVRFSPGGVIDARDGAAYRAETVIPYNPGTWYRFRISVDVPRHTYSAYVQPEGGEEGVIGADLGFRAEQSDVTSLDHWALWSGVGSLQVRNFLILPGQAD